MTTTKKFQVLPDYYDNLIDCKNNENKKIVTNSRYSNFTQTHFTAGDENQFNEYRDSVNGEICLSKIIIKNSSWNSSSNSLLEGL